VQWVFSDGLASVSLFLESYDRQRHNKESGMSMGATHTLTRHIGNYWLTAMGEVPMATLKQFASGLAHKK
jgi:sigma-E factor negative regulatory protein RseB